MAGACCSTRLSNLGDYNREGVGKWNLDGPDRGAIQRQQPEPPILPTAKESTVRAVAAR